MKIYKYTEDLNAYSRSISDNPDDVLYFDIETTGLSPMRSDLYIIGYGYIQDNLYHINLLFNDDGISEPDMLSEFSDLIKKYKYLVSYNGGTFDIPYIRTKFKQFDIADTLDTITSIDVYKTTRKYKKIFQLPSVKQVDIEDIVGFKRQSYISGGDLIAAYKNYLHNNSQELLQSMLTHNLDDIRGLISISDCVNLSHLHECHVETIENTDSAITYTCSIPYIPCRLTYADSHFRINAYHHSMHVSVFVVHTSMKYYFKDYKNYYYLPMEGIAIHKSMATYVDSSHKEKATKNTAFTIKESNFVYSPGKKNKEVFYNTDNRDTGYIEVSSHILAPCNDADCYVSQIITSALPHC